MGHHLLLLMGFKLGFTLLSRTAQLARTAKIYAMERKRMKAEDMAIELESDTESHEEEAPPVGLKVMLKTLPNGETASQSVDPTVYAKEITHFKHPHELNQVDSDKIFTCGGCGEVGQGKRYSCQHKDCKSSSQFEVHLFCALPPTLLLSQSPDQIIWSHRQLQPTMIRTFAHKDHRVKEVYKNAGFVCDRCKTNGNGMRYHCEHCNINLHQVCAEHPYRISSFMHPQHELVLKTKDKFEACALCRKMGDSNTRMYGCDDCSFYLHPTCSQWPKYLVHSLHPLHPLQLKYKPSSSKKWCDAKHCWKKCKHWRYRCDACDVDFHLKCILSKSVKSGGITVKGILLNIALKCALDLAVGHFKHY